MGITHDLPKLIPGVEMGVGVNATTYSLPPAIKPYYGDRPHGVDIYLRLRL
jgi:hypothetical protein